MKSSNILEEISNFIGLIFITLVMLPFLADFFLFNPKAALIALTIIILNFGALFLMDKEKVNILYKKQQEMFYSYSSPILFITLMVLLALWFFDRFPKLIDHTNLLFYNIFFTLKIVFQWLVPIMLSVFLCLPTIDVLLKSRKEKSIVNEI